MIDIVSKVSKVKVHERLSTIDFNKVVEGNDRHREQSESARIYYCNWLGLEMR